MTRSLLKCERGNSFIELAFAAPLLVALLLGMVDISRAVSTKLQVVQVAQRTVERVQRSNFQYSDLAALKTEAEAAAGSGAVATAEAWLECGSSTSKISFSSSCSSGQAYARFVSISVTKPFTPIFTPQYFAGVVIDGTAGVRIQ